MKLDQELPHQDKESLGRLSAALCRTIFEDRSDGTWQLGSRIEPVLVDGVFYLRTSAFDAVKDDLGSILEY